MSAPPFVPQGMTHAQHVLDEAEKAFARGDQKGGVIDLAHAVLVVARDGMDVDEAAAWFRRVTAAAGAWEL